MSQDILRLAFHKTLTHKYFLPYLYIVYIYIYIYIYMI